MTKTDDETLRFISATFPSIWALELLLQLKREAGPRSRQELIERLRASEVVVNRALDSLVAAGLVSLEREVATFQPANRSIKASVERAETLYLRRPNSVRRAIIAAQISSAAAFADAFRLRRDTND